MKHSKIFLIGLPASGKTTWGKRIAQELNLPFIDLDEEIVRTANQSIAAIFEQDGEATFREVESKALQSVISTNDKFVLATGGGTPCFANNLELMNSEGVTVFLNISLPIIEERLKGNSTRPLMKKHKLVDLHNERKHWYKQAAHTVSSYEELQSLLRT